MSAAAAWGPAAGGVGDDPSGFFGESAGPSGFLGKGANLASVVSVAGEIQGSIGFPGTPGAAGGAPSSLQSCPFLRVPGPLQRQNGSSTFLHFAIYCRDFSIYCGGPRHLFKFTAEIFQLTAEIFNLLRSFLNLLRCSLVLLRLGWSAGGARGRAGGGRLAGEAARRCPELQLAMCCACFLRVRVRVCGALVFAGGRWWGHRGL